MLRRVAYWLVLVFLFMGASPARAGEEPDILITSDRLLYRPGERVRLRVLVLGRVSRRALAKQGVKLTVDSPEGELLSRKVETNTHGVAAVTLPLDRAAPVGRYRATARAGSAASHRYLRVREYETPRHLIEVQTTPGHLPPGGAVTVRVRARYQHGPPVAGGRVTVRASTLIGAEGRAFARARLTLSGAGVGEVPLRAPAYLGKIKALADNATVHLEVAVTDPAGHREETTARLPVARQALMLGAHWLHPPLAGVKNRLALTAQNPDGSPADAALTARSAAGRTVAARTGADGVALVDLLLGNNEPVTVTAPCGTGRCTHEASPPRPAAKEPRHRCGLDDAAKPPAFNRLAMVVERPVVRTGEPIKVELRTGRPTGTVALELRAGKRTLLRREVSL